MPLRIRSYVQAGLLLACSAGVFAQAGKLPLQSADVPKVGEKAPDFTLPDQDGKPVKLSAVLSESEGPKNAPALLLIFYRGYW